MNIKFLIKMISIILIFIIIFSLSPVKSYAADNSNSGWSLISDIIKKAVEVIKQAFAAIFNPGNTGGITLSETSKTINVGASFTLTANISSVIWGSSDSTVATVENGKVTGVKAGTATIKATADGKTATCEVTVKALSALGGTYTKNNDTTAKTVGTFKSNINNKTFKILRQSEISGWSSLCNRASSACIASGYSSESTDKLISTINTYASNYSYIPSAEASGNAYFGNYGLEITERETSDSTATTLLRDNLVSQLTNGGYALVRVNTSFKGESGTAWSNSSNGHWLAIIGYDGSKVFVADSRSNSNNTTGWYPVSEFTNNNRGTIDYAIFVSKK